MRLDHGRTETREIVLDPTLVVRGTTAPPRWPGRRWSPGVWAFSHRPSAAGRRGRTGSILAVSVVPRRRKAPRRDARIEILATAVRCRRRWRWPAACRRG